MIRFKRREDISMNKDNIKMLNGVFVDVLLIDAEEKSLQWLTGWDAFIVKNIISAIKRADRMSQV
ncbi:hypothetical protein [Macellibacteroides fermentans]|uniref:hypothetical protein n=1 Tax=Macellibacteroides fermentans TaxID=879969 RepID=UPI00406D162D